MNIIDAIKSGKPFRCKNTESWMTTQYFLETYIPSNRQWWERLVPDLLSDNYEVEEQLIPISKSQCQKIFEFGMKHGSYSQLHNEAYKEYVEYLKELGFE